MLKTAIARIRHSAWAVSRRLRWRLLWHSLFCRKIIKTTGTGNTRERTIFYISALHLLEKIPSFFRRNHYDYLIANNFIEDEFLSSPRPKIFITLEPPPLMTAETREHMQSAILRPYLYLYTEADIDKRMFYPALPHRRETLIRKLDDSLTKKRSKLCCIINRYSENTELNLVRQRINFVKAAGQDIDIYGKEPRNCPNKWHLFGNYYGMTKNKQETLKEYNFALTFENSDFDGYITEKILHAFMAGTIPLYWGGGQFLRETFPANCYIDCRDKDPREIFDLIKSMSQSDIIAYRKAARVFLESDAANRFTRIYLIGQMIRRLEAMSQQ
jgi:hypothetical protein